MKHVFDFITSDEETSVSRILAMVHQAIDRDLPSAQPAPPRFAKTVFGDEPTLNQTMPIDVSTNQIKAKVDMSGDNDAKLLDPNKALRGIQLSNHDIEDPTEEFQSIENRRRSQTFIASIILVTIMVVSFIIWSNS